MVTVVNPQPIAPTWSELEDFFSRNCTKRVKTPAETLNWKKVLTPGNPPSQEVLQHKPRQQYTATGRSVGRYGTVVS